VLLTALLLSKKEKKRKMRPGSVASLKRICGYGVSGKIEIKQDKKKGI
jgi:hypothetical protein